MASKDQPGPRPALRCRKPDPRARLGNGTGEMIGAEGCGQERSCLWQLDTGQGPRSLSIYPLWVGGERRGMGAAAAQGMRSPLTISAARPMGMEERKEEGTDLRLK